VSYTKRCHLAGIAPSPQALQQGALSAWTSEFKKLGRDGEPRRVFLFWWTLPRRRPKLGAVQPRSSSFDSGIRGSKMGDPHFGKMHLHGP